METCALAERGKILAAIREGAILAYPTDTVYGIGCNALLPTPVRKVSLLKGTDHPFSVIAPSLAWVRRHLVVRHPAFLEGLPGPVTLLLEKKDPRFLRACSPGRLLGIRIPAHPIAALVRAARVPLVTTSANLSGQPTARSLRELPGRFRQADLWVDGGTLGRQASRIWDLSGGQPKEIRRKGALPLGGQRKKGKKTDLASPA
ncbi:MAG: L-threonylcarbamoyladenylate synthase [Candidatus Aenigmarchaeota archaeon]|nr:L-threonylcarbamoyladenylate synthase [Candidatus Aenigmarchaeota archaeon]